MKWKYFNLEYIGIITSGILSAISYWVSMLYIDSDFTSTDGLVLYPSNDSELQHINIFKTSDVLLKSVVSISMPSHESSKVKKGPIRLDFIVSMIWSGANSESIRSMEIQ